MKKAFKSFKSKLQKKKSKSKQSGSESKSCSETSDDVCCALSPSDQTEEDYPTTKPSRRNKFLPSRKFAQQKEMKKLLDKKFTYKEVLYARLPTFSQVVPGEKELAFIKMCRLCTLVFSFSKISPTEYINARRAKQQLLRQIEDGCAAQLGWMTLDSVAAFKALLVENLFLPATSVTLTSGDFPPNSVITFDWDHLAPIYRAAAKLIANESTSEEHINELFTINVSSQLLQRLGSADSKERASARRLLHRVCAFREDVRDHIEDLAFEMLEQIVSEDIYDVFGADELLGLLASFVAGWETPLSPAKIRRFRTIILPLFALTTPLELSTGMRQCLGRFVEKDPLFAGDILAAVARLYPPQMVDALLYALPAVVQAVEKGEDFPAGKARIAVSDAIVEGLAKALGDPNHQTAEKTLQLLEYRGLHALLERGEGKGVGILLGALARNKGHWSDAIREMSLREVELLRGAGVTELESLSDKGRRKEERRKSFVGKKLVGWGKLRQEARAKGWGEYCEE